MANASQRLGLRINTLFITLLLSAFIHLLVVGTNSNAAADTDDDRPTLALVNEDLPGQFNGKDYTFGASFIDRISKDSDYNWVVLSRAVAEKAYSDRSVDAVLYIPQSFTHDILTLEDLSPTRATIEYKIQPQVDEQADQLLENKIINVVHSFNEGVIKMYYASLVDSIAQADGQMTAALGNQEALVEALTADVQEPFSRTVPNIDHVLSNATSLQKTNASTIKAQNSFLESVTKLIASNGDGLTSQLPKIEEYAKRQQDIAQINTANSNRGIVAQATSDLHIYQSQFDGLKTNTLCMLGDADAANLPESCTDSGDTVAPDLNGIVTVLKGAVADYTNNHNDALEALAANYDERITNLTAIKDLLEPRPEPSEPIDPENPVKPLGPEDLEEPVEPIEPEEPADPEEPSEPEEQPNFVDQEIIDSLQDEIQALQTARESLTGSLPAPTTLEAPLAALNTWHISAKSSIENASMTANSISNLRVNDWSSYSPDNPGLYIDSGNDLYTSITELITQGSQVSNEISSNAISVPDNTSQFDALLQSATTTRQDTQSILDGLNELATTGSTGVEENQAYYTNFAKILANTRTPGVDTGTIYNFFSAPIDAISITPQRPAVVSVTATTSWFDSQVAVVFGSGLIAGILVMLVGGIARKRRKTATPTTATSV